MGQYVISGSGHISKPLIAWENSEKLNQSSRDRESNCCFVVIVVVFFPSDGDYIERKIFSKIGVCEKKSQPAKDD